jgi:hypothetical protein
VDKKEQLNNIDLFKYFLSDKSDHLTTTEKIVALALLRHRNNVSMKCYPGVKKLADITGLHRISISRAMAGLIKKREIVRKKKFTNHYFFRYDFERQLQFFNDPGSVFCTHYFDEAEIFDSCLKDGTFKAFMR